MRSDPEGPMSIRPLLKLSLALAILIVFARPALAQTSGNTHTHGHTMSAPDSTHHPASGHTHTHGHTVSMPDSTRHSHGTQGAHQHGTSPTRGMEGMDHSHMGTMEHGDHMAMNAMYGPYPIAREASGTSWQPDRAMHRGLHEMKGPWMLMLHGAADIVFDNQGGPRGDRKVFGSNMLMGMAQRPIGPGTLGLRTMISLEPATIGKEGYPLLLQTGETANGRTHLIDRQHPHDLFMEVAASYSVSSANRSAFLYAG